MFPSGHFEWHAACNSSLQEEKLMLKLALTFLLIGLVAVLLGFTSIAGASFAIAKFFAFLFLALFLVFLILGMSIARRV